MSVALATTSHRTDRAGLVLRLAGAAALGYSAWLHFRIAADSPPLAADGKVTLSGLFVAQAVAATLVSLWVVVHASRLAWLAFGAVALGSLAALLVSTWVTIPSIGPLPAIHDPVWFTDKVLAAVAAGVATLVAALALTTYRHRAGHRDDR